MNTKFSKAIIALLFLCFFIGYAQDQLVANEKIPELVDSGTSNDVIGDKKFTLQEGGSTFKISYFSNVVDVKDTNNDKITRAVVVLHGANRNAGTYYKNMLEAAKMESNQLDTLLIISPQFVIEDDINEFALDEEHLYWSGGWRQGNLSKDTSSNPRSERVSSYTVIDSIMVKLSEYPSLKTIVFSGHSAGGQFVNRYAATSPIPDILSTMGIDVSFIVNNSSSYVYMDNRRKVIGTEHTFEVPESANCTIYNEYKFGLDDLPFYLREVGGADVIRERLPLRKVTYLVGQNDNDPNSSLLDVTCQALLQGANRYERAHNYFDYLLNVYGSAINTNQKIEVVPGVGHSHSGMFQSEKGRRNTFRN